MILCICLANVGLGYHLELEDPKQDGDVDAQHQNGDSKQIAFMEKIMRTKENDEKKQSQNYEELDAERENTSKSILEVAIWLGWKPIPYWLYKLHGLGQIDTEKGCSEAVHHDNMPFMHFTLQNCAKVNSLALGDNMSRNLTDQAWKKMVQALSEANFGNVQQILEIGPPKWLPDSCATACMLCNVRFHPLMCTIHHCRFCGGVFCSQSSKERSLVPIKFCAPAILNGSSKQRFTIANS
ncbi:hypothetical protein L1987_20980 [Smallanthus sonchifolius]|uniref:Uncharacterized protein n=1 Tax=Smallanthus sonchifolius TaxID=185202 RepID=A0ACB9IV01_9ASTR|nr:hypothetical protein L1987_20980 [Smallanthus sonchifolius]